MQESFASPEPRALAASDDINYLSLHLRKKVMRESSGHSASANGGSSRPDASAQSDLSASIVGNAACTAAAWKGLGSRWTCSRRGIEEAIRILMTRSSGRAPRPCTQLLCGSKVSCFHAIVPIQYVEVHAYVPLCINLP